MPTLCSQDGCSVAVIEVVLKDGQRAHVRAMPFSPQYVRPSALYGRVLVPDNPVERSHVIDQHTNLGELPEGLIHGVHRHDH